MLGKSITMAVLVGLSCLSTAHASVVYNWTPLSSGDHVGTVSGQLIVSGNAYRRHTISFDNMTDFNHPAVEHAEMILTGGSIDIDVPDYEQQGLLANLTFLSDGYLRGTLDLFGINTNLDAAGDGKLWTISDVNSDYFNEFGYCTGAYDETCSGGTGYWLVDADTLPVDEPSGNWVLFGASTLALFGLAWVRRRQST